MARRESGEVRPWPVVETIQVNPSVMRLLHPRRTTRDCGAAAAAAVTIASELGSPVSWLLSF